MERDVVTRAMTRLAHCVSRLLVVAAFAGMGHASAATGQAAMKARDKATVPKSMASCPPCVACLVVPALEPGTTASIHHPDQIAFRSPMRPTDELRHTQAHMPANAIRPTIAVRFLYCRWLN